MMKPKVQKKELLQIQNLINEIDSLKDVYTQEKVQISQYSRRSKAYTTHRRIELARVKEDEDMKKHAKLIEDTRLGKAAAKQSKPPSFLTTDNTHEAFANSLRSTTPKSATRKTNGRTTSFIKRQMTDIARRKNVMN